MRNVWNKKSVTTLFQKCILLLGTGVNETSMITFMHKSCYEKTACNDFEMQSHRQAKCD